MELRTSTMMLIAVLLLCTIHGTFARTFTPCEVARELHRHGIRRDQLNDWTCLIWSESGGNTRAINTVNEDGSRDYGLFQINSKFWCSENGRGNGCNIACSELLTDDISVAVQCAKIIREVQGFSAWVGWRNKCQGRPLQDVTRCLPQPSCGCGPNYSFY